jgi:hypothetical protein
MVPVLPVNRAWFEVHRRGVVDEELRAVKPRWIKAFLLNSPTEVKFRNGYRKDSPSVSRKIEGIDLVPVSSLRPGEAEAHGFDASTPVIRLRLGAVV